jgi:hypothetical protein
MTELETSVRRLVTRCRPEDAQTRRSQLSHALDALDWSPAGLPPTAILCLRRLAVPPLGALQTTGPAPWQPTDAWRAGFSKSLEQSARYAARPAHEAVGADANAVLFADHAELLACLALDWCAGSKLLGWWWKALFPVLDFAEAVQKAWTESPQHVPAALCKLEQTGCGETFLRALRDPVAARMLENVLLAFGLADLSPMMPRMTADTPLQVSFRRDELAKARDAAPWSRWVRVNPSFSLPQQLLLIVCVMLERAPGVLRSARFARALREWNDVVHSVEPLPPLAARNAAAQTLPRPSEPRENFPLDVAGADNRPPSPQTAPEPVATHPQKVSDVPLQCPEFPAGALTGPGLLASSAGANTVASLKPNSVSARRPVSFAEPLAEIVVHTEWGGVFYLVNVALALGLYGDFTTPRQPGLALPVWDFLALAGLRLIGSKFESDPLWTVLARLSVRGDDEPPGLWFDPPADWRIPADRLAPFERSELRWSAALGRLRVIHPRGFVVVDVPLDSEPSQQLADELRRIGAQAATEAAGNAELPPAPPANPLERWLDLLVPFIQARLGRALAEANHEALLVLAFQHHARVELTASRVDVRFQLAEHPIELRLAGLDRDPGWLPAAGHTLTFYYD